MISFNFLTWFINNTWDISAYILQPLIPLGQGPCLFVFHCCTVKSSHLSVGEPVERFGWVSIIPSRLLTPQSPSCCLNCGYSCVYIYTCIGVKWRIHWYKCCHCIGVLISFFLWVRMKFFILISKVLLLPSQEPDTTFF